MMMSQFLTPQASSREHLKLAVKLQNEMGLNFLEHIMYDVNDALTSILALCDMEDMKSIPKVKTYIQKVNQLLKDVHVYQNVSIFNINHVVENVIDVIKYHFRNKTKIDYSFSNVNALTEGDQLRLEQVLLYILVEIMSVNSEANESKIFISLHQKEKDAQVLIKNTGFNFSSASMAEIDKFKEGFSGSIQVENNNNELSVSIKVPLSFKKPKRTDMNMQEPASHIKVSTPKIISQQNVSTFSR
jgi:hypothetical protein